MFVAYTSGSSEPLDWEAVKAQIRADDDTDQSFVETYIIPAARQMAEAKTGAILRESTFTDTWNDVKKDVSISFPIGGVKSIESVVADGEALTADDYELVHVGNASFVKFGADHDKVAVNYTAGIDTTTHPGVLSWMLLACAWAYSQREIMLAGQSIEMMPDSYLDSMLAPIRLEPRF